MFLGKNLFREYYSLGIKFREQVFLGIFFEGVFLPLAQNSGAFFSYRGKKKSRLCAIAQNSLPLTSIFETRWGVDPKIFKKTLLERVYEKMVSNLSILEGIFEAKFQSWFFWIKYLEGFFFRNFFPRISLVFLRKNLEAFFFRKIL